MPARLRQLEHVIGRQPMAGGQAATARSYTQEYADAAPLLLMHTRGLKSVSAREKTKEQMLSRDTLRRPTAAPDSQTGDWSGEEATSIG
jgi:hypothetical protein